MNERERWGERDYLLYFNERASLRTIFFKKMSKNMSGRAKFAATLTQKQRSE